MKNKIESSIEMINEHITTAIKYYDSDINKYLSMGEAFGRMQTLRAFKMINDKQFEYLNNSISYRIKVDIEHFKLLGN